MDREEDSRLLPLRDATKRNIDKELLRTHLLHHPIVDVGRELADHMLDLDGEYKFVRIGRPVEGESRTHLVSQFSSDEVERQVTVVDYGITESAEEREMCKVRPTTERHLDLRRDAFNSDQRECAD
jgi:hypothetical protein